MGKLALIVDDEADIRELLEITLARMDIKTVSAADLTAARSSLASQRFDLCLTDMRLPDGTGLELLHDIERNWPEMPVAVITAYGNTQAAIDSLKAGAFDFVSKPVDLNVLRSLVSTALKLSIENETTVKTELVGDAEAIRDLRKKMTKLARSQAPVLIRGESGTGKELVANIIHESGPRSSGMFVPVNCGAIPSELMESEFFGHLKGSFSGADRDKPGLFQAANGGTLFLDEVGELPLQMQVKLLRAIQERAVRPVGSEQEVAVDVRIASATHRNLKALVDAGQFRQDLYYRLNVIELTVPALRERRSDIPLLAEHILQRLAESHALERVPTLTEPALAALALQPFPGNIRELENVLERAITLTESESLDVSALALDPSGATTQGRHSPEHDADVTPLDQRIEQVEKAAIEEALEASRYNKTKAAKMLGISFRALRYRLKKLGLE